MNPLKGRSIPATSYAWLVLLIGALSIFGTVMDRGASNVVIPTLAKEFKSDLPTVQWVLIAYLLTLAALLLPMGRLADIIGRKRLIIIGLCIFSLGSAATATSANLPLLFTSRVLQGVGSAMIQGTSMTLVVDAFGANQRGKSVGLILIFVGLGNIAGPAMGGFITGLIGWRAVFLTSGSITILSSLLSILILKKDSHLVDISQKFDWLGSFLCVAMLVGLLGGFTMSSRVGWISPITLICFLSFIIFGIGFCRRSLNTKAPVLDLSFFRKPLFTTSVISNLFCFFGMASVWFLLPFYLEYVHGYSPAQVGMVFIPAAIFMAISSPLSGRLSDKFGWRKFTVGGMLMASAGLGILSTLNENSSAYVACLSIIPISSGMGIFYGPNNSATLSVVGDSNYGSAIGLINLIRNSGNIISISLSALIVSYVMGSMGYAPDLSNVIPSSQDGSVDAFISGMKVTFATVTIFTIGAAILSFYKGHINTSDDKSPSFS